MARACVFCGATPTTREHVWPDWLRRKLSIDEPLQHTQTFERHGEVVDRIHFDARPYQLRAKAVCANCNGGWMSRLEESAKSILDGMVEGRGRVLHRGGQEVLATWALLKAMMFDQAVPAEARAVFPSLYSYLFEHRRPPEDAVRVWLSAYDGELVGFTGFAALEATAAGEEDPGERNVFSRTFSMGRVLVQVFGTTSSALLGMNVDWSAFGPPPEPPVLQIWPTGESSTWRSQPALGDKGAVWFANQLAASLVQHAERYKP